MIENLSKEEIELAISKIKKFTGLNFIIMMEKNLIIFLICLAKVWKLFLIHPQKMT